MASGVPMSSSLCAADMVLPVAAMVLEEMCELPDLSGDALLLAEFFPFYQNPTSAALLLLLQAVSSRTNLEGAKLAKKISFLCSRWFYIIDYNDIQVLRSNE